MQQLLNICLKFRQHIKQLGHYLGMRQHCLLCAADDVNEGCVCDSCVYDMPWHDGPQCQTCNLPSNHSICGACLKNMPNFDCTVSIFRYNYPLSYLIQRYKYQEALHISQFFALALLQKINHTDKRIAENTRQHRIDLIIPMPMHANRIKERGFNQALEIARILSKRLNIPLNYRACTRTKYTPPQASLPLKKRKQNVAGVFACTPTLQGLNVAVIDDVMTTGASLNELARTLKNAGACYVECWVVARTLAK